MGKSAPDPAPAPDPYATARAQTASNVDTAIANTVLGNANERSPLGTVRYQQNGSYSMSSPVLDANGAPTTTRRWVADKTEGATPNDPNNRVLDYFDQNNNPVYRNSATGAPWDPFATMGGGHWVEEAATTTRDIPIWERIVELSPEQQALYDKQLGVQSNLMDLASSQSSRIKDALSSPLNFDDIPDYTKGVLQRILADDGSVSRARVEQALTDRMAPQMAQSRDALENKLVNQGFSRGTDGFRSSMDEASRAENDARLAIIAAGGQEQQLQQALAMAQLQAASTTRERAIQERMATRNAPINEISALLSQAQVQMPQFTPYQAGTIAGTPVGDYVYRSADINQKNAQIAAQQAASTNSGLFGLGSAALGGLLSGGTGGFATSAIGKLFSGSDIRIKTDIRMAGSLRNGLPLYTYRYKAGGPEQLGVMAQDVEAVHPDAVIELFGVKLVDYSQVYH